MVTVEWEVARDAGISVSELKPMIIKQIEHDTGRKVVSSSTEVDTRGDRKYVTTEAVLA